MRKRTLMTVVVVMMRMMGGCANDDGGDGEKSDDARNDSLFSQLTGCNSHPSRITDASW